MSKESKEHTCEADLQAQALQALYNLACKYENKHIIHKENGIELIVNVINNNHDHVHIQMVACRKSRNMCYHVNKIKLQIHMKVGLRLLLEQ